MPKSAVLRPFGLYPHHRSARRHETIDPIPLCLWVSKFQPDDPGEQGPDEEQEILQYDYLGRFHDCSRRLWRAWIRQWWASSGERQSWRYICYRRHLHCPRLCLSHGADGLQGPAFIFTLRLDRCTHRLRHLDRMCGRPGLPFSLVMVAGAAIGGATLAIPAWTAAFTTGGIGGVLAEILVGRLGGFSKFILVVIAWSVVPACVRDICSVTVAIPAMAPILRRVPRIIITVIVTAAMIGVAISASNSFIVSLSSLLSIISYQSGSTTTIFLLEWLIIRKANPASFDPEVWNDGKALPSGIPALLTTAISWGPVVCGMSTGWYVGPIGRKVGDLGFEFAVIVSLLVYIPLRTIEIKYRGRL